MSFICALFKQLRQLLVFADAVSHFYVVLLTSCGVGLQQKPVLVVVFGLQVRVVPHGKASTCVRCGAVVCSLS